LITRGSKFFYAAAVVGFVAAVLYGFLTGASDHGGVYAVFTDGAVVKSIIGPISLGWKGWVGEHIGYTVLMSFSGVMLVLGILTTATRDADAEALAQIDGVDLADLPPATTPFGISWWPLVAAFSAGIVVVGLAFSTVLFYVGLVGLVVAAFEWTVRAWSERATADPALNQEYRNRLMRPLEVPVGAVLVIAVLGLAVSRILLAISGNAAAYLIIVLAAVVFGLANLLASRPELKRPVIITVLVVGALALIGGGIAAGIAGPKAKASEGLGAFDSAPPAVGVNTDSTGTQGY